MNFKEMGYEGVDWTQLAQDRVRWQAPVKTFGFHKTWGNY
jgi:hypothetical protein